MLNEAEDGRVITLCGVQGCCPTIELTETEIVLRDDFGGRVKLTPAQWADLTAKVRAGELA